MALKEVTDPTLLATLNKVEVTDPAILAQLEGTKGSDQKLAWKDVPGEAVSNIGASAAEYGKNLVQPILHPIDTLNALVGENADPKAILDFFKQRYGSEEGFKQAIAKDPVGILADFSSLLTGGGTALSKVGSLANVSKLSKAGEVASAVGKATEPLSVAGKVLSPVVKTAGEVGSGTLGFTTGSGKASIQKAFEGGKDFTDAMRGKVSGEEILSTTKGALQSIKDDRAATYLPRLQDLSKNTKQLDMTPIKNTLGSLKKAFNIRDNPDGTLDFSRSTINKNAVGDTEQIISIVDDWLNDPVYQNPSGLDILKRKLDDFYSESKNSRVLVSALKNKVKETIVKEVPEYALMVKDYEKSSNFIDEITRTLSVGDRATADTGIRKLMTALKDNYDFRRDLMGKIDDATGNNIQSKIAGYNLSGLTPQGFMGKSFDVGILAGAFLAADPKIASALVLASPRVVGEFMNVFGKLYNTEQKIRSIVKPSIRQGAFQTGRAANTNPQMVE